MHRVRHRIALAVSVVGVLLGVPAVAQADGPVNTAPPTVTRGGAACASACSPTVGDTLVGTRGSWSGDPAAISYSYSWQRCDVDSTGPFNCTTLTTFSGTPDSSPLVLQPADRGHVIVFQVAATDTSGTATVSSAPTGVVLRQATPNPDVIRTDALNPSDTDFCDADCRPFVGDQLTGTKGSWADPSSSFSYSWLRCDDAGVRCQTITSFSGPDAAAQPLVLSPADRGATIRFRVYAANASGTQVRDSGPTGVVRRHVPTAPPASLVAPTIAPGSPHDGTQLAGDVGRWDDTFSEYRYAVQWLRCDGFGQGCVTVARQDFVRRDDAGGATTVAYTPTTADVGSTLRLEVEASNTVGATRRISDPSAVVLPSGPPVLLSGAVLLVGSNGASAARVGGNPVAVGDTLTVGRGEWRNADDGRFAIRWLRCDRSGETCLPMQEYATPPPPAEQRTSYRVGTGDNGLSIRAEVTAGNALGSATSRTAPVKVGPDTVTAGSGGSGSSSSGGSKGSARTVDISTATVSSSVRTVAIRVSLRRAGTLTVTASELSKGSRSIGKARKTVGQPGKVTVTVPLAKRVRKALAGGRSVRARVVATVKVSGGGTATRSEKLTLRRSRR